VTHFVKNYFISVLTLWHSRIFDSCHWLDFSDWHSVY